MQQTKVKKCTSPGRANRYVAKMAAQGWVLAGPVQRSGIINKRYLVTLTRELTPTRPDTAP